MSTDGVLNNQQMLQDSAMNIGKRIEARLAELNWTRKKLLEELPELSPQALSNLIVRDSKRSEWDEKLAEAMNVSVLWLVYGRDESSQTPGHHVSENTTNNIYRVDSPQQAKVMSIMRNLSPARQDEIERFAIERQTLDSVGSDNSISRVGQ